MIRKILKAKVKDKNKAGDNTPMKDFAVIKAHSDIIFSKIEQKIKALNAIESSVDEKIAKLERLMQRAESIKNPSAGADRHHELVSLTQRGLTIAEISDIFDIPAGEVELILNLHTVKT